MREHLRSGGAHRAPYSASLLQAAAALYGADVAAGLSRPRRCDGPSSKTIAKSGSEF
jgi:hypothetical protein